MSSVVTGISSMNISFILKSIVNVTYNSGVYVKESTSNEFEVDYYKKLEEVIEF
jgi:hypothetical protein